MFDFNASLNDALPVSPMFLSVDLVRMKKNYLLIDFIYVSFPLFSLQRLSFVSVVFDFNASLSDVAPASPILLTVDLMRMEKGGLLRMPFVCCFFCVHISD